MPRLFIGLELPELLKSQLVWPRSGVEGARWQRDDQLHLTLAFVGDVSNKIAEDVDAQLASMTMIPFELELSGVGFFGKPAQPKALWAGVRDQAPIRHLHEKVSYAMERIGVDVDQRRFLPHVTLARFRRGAQARIGDWLSENERLSSETVWVNHFTLFSSHLTCERAHYDIERRYGSWSQTDLEATALGGYEDGAEDWMADDWQSPTAHAAFF